MDWTSHLLSRRTNAGAWTREQLRAIGVGWPPRKGWLKRIATEGLKPGQVRALDAASHDWRKRQAEPPADDPETALATYCYRPLLAKLHVPDSESVLDAASLGRLEAQRRDRRVYVEYRGVVVGVCSNSNLNEIVRDYEVKFRQKGSSGNDSLS